LLPLFVDLAGLSGREHAPAQRLSPPRFRASRFSPVGQTFMGSAAQFLLPCSARHPVGRVRAMTGHQARPTSLHGRCIVIGQINRQCREGRKVPELALPLQKPLPEIAAQGFKVAIKCKEGSALPDEVETAQVRIVNSLREWGAYSNQYPMEHTVSFILGCYQDLDHERGLASCDRDFPSDFVFHSLKRIETFESNHELFRKLLREYFPS
jgi:hypothetical protein